MKKVFEKIISKLAGIPADKYMHFAVGSIIGAAVFLLARLFLFCPVAFGLSVLAVLTAAAWKELRHDTVADIRDFWATLAGGAVVWTAILLG